MTHAHLLSNSSFWQWVDDIGGVENLGNKLLKKKKDEKLPVFVPPEVSILNEIFLKRAMSVCVCV